MDIYTLVVASVWWLVAGYVFWARLHSRWWAQCTALMAALDLAEQEAEGLRERLAAARPRVPVWPQGPDGVRVDPSATRPAGITLAPLRQAPAGSVSVWGGVQDAEGR